MVITQELLVKEEKLKESVYKTFDEMSSKASSDVRSQQKTIDRSAFDDKEAFMVHGKLSEVQKKKHEVEILISKLYERPYFSHVEMNFEGEEDVEHYFLLIVKA